MEYTVIDVPDINDSISHVVLGGKYYQIRFTYNDTMDYWSFGLYDSSGSPIAIGIKIVPGTVLNQFFGRMELPQGAFGVITNLEHIGRDDFSEGRAKFIFVPADNGDVG